MQRIEKNVKVSIVLITFNKASRLFLTLESLKRAEHINDTELIIVNDGSTDGTKELVESFKNENKNLNVKLIHINNSGRSIARNTGIIASTGDLIIFIDDDIIVSRKFIEHHKKAHDNQDNLINHGMINSFPLLKFMSNPITGELYNGGIAKNNILERVLTPEIVRHEELLDTYINDNARLSKFEKDIYELFNNTKSNDNYVRWISATGGNISIRRNVLFDLENFDPYMGKAWGCEDLELGYRAYKAGCKFNYCREAVNYHISHYRHDFSDIHNNSINYFINKHRSNSITLLNDYFNGNINSLIEWKKLIDEGDK